MLASPTLYHCSFRHRRRRTVRTPTSSATCFTQTSAIIQTKRSYRTYPKCPPTWIKRRILFPVFPPGRGPREGYQRVPSQPAPIPTGLIGPALVVGGSFVSMMMGGCRSWRARARYVRVIRKSGQSRSRRRIRGWILWVTCLRPCSIYLPYLRSTKITRLWKLLGIRPRTYEWTGAGLFQFQLV